MARPIARPTMLASASGELYNRGRPVQLFVVRQRMRIWSDNTRMNQRRPFSLACEVDSSFERVVTRQQITAIHFFDEEIWKGTNQLRDAAAGGIYFHRNRDGVA